MSKLSSIIVNALEYYDVNNEKYKSLKEKAKFVRIEKSNNDMEHNVMLFFDKNKNFIFKSRYEVIGMMGNESKIWTWGWAIPYLKKNTVKISKEILLYGINLNPEDDKILKTELITSRFRIANDVQLDIHLGLSSYMSKKPFIFKYSFSEEKWSSNSIYLDLSGGHISSYLFLLDHENFDI
jgi:hypothetical protein